MKIKALGDRGFGLIEIMVVVSIIGLLAGGGVTATQHMRGKAKDAKVKTEVHSVESALEVYASTAGGMPNPFPSSTRRLYCVGSTECSFQGKAVPDKLEIEGLPEFGDELATFSNDLGIDQGYIYMSCADPDALVCAPEDTALMYGMDDEEWLHWFDQADSWEIEDDFDWGEWGIDWNEYDDYVADGGGGDSGNNYVCDPGVYPYGTFEVYSSMSTDAPVLFEEACTYDAEEGHYVCTNTCNNAAYHFKVIVIYGSYPYDYNACHDRTGFFDPCIDYQGGGGNSAGTFCNYYCD